MAGISTPEWIELGSARVYQGANRQKRVKFPFQSGHYILKSQWEHTSIGLDDDSIAYVRDLNEMQFLLESRDSMAGDVFMLNASYKVVSLICLSF